MILNTGVRHGVTLLGASPSGAVYVARQVAYRAWAILEISAPDLLRVSESDTMPQLDSAKCVVMGPTKSECLRQFQQQAPPAAGPIGKK
jgi:hypothetical protein